jgi:hypothetical protein
MNIALSRHRRLPRSLRLLSRLRLRNNFVGVAVVLASLGAATFAHAQNADQTETAPPKPKKKPKKKPVKEEPKPAAEAPKSADTEEAKPPAADTETKPEGDGSKAPAEGAAARDEGKAGHDEAGGGAGVDITDTREDPATRYYFIGLRYRGTVIPQFILNLFADEGTTIYSNMFGAEFEIRKGGQSMIPWITYSDYGTGDMLFHQKGSDTAIAGNYSVVHSSLKMIILGLDELWSVPIDHKHWDFEFGFGVGLGIVFGDLQNNWVSQVPNGTPGALTASTGVSYLPCAADTVNNGPNTPVGCSTQDHQMANVRKVGGFKEPFLFSGGAIPNIFPNVWFPTLALRYKPIKQFQARLGVGFSLTGFWFGLSGDYGLESAEAPGGKTGGQLLRMRDTL